MRKLFFSKTFTTIIVVLLALCALPTRPSMGLTFKNFYDLEIQTYPAIRGSKAPILEKMQLVMAYAYKEQIEAKLRAGEPVHFGDIEVTSEPEGAGVLVSSYVPLAKTPITIVDVLVGQQRVTVRKDGYYEQVRMVDITNGGLAKEHFKLEPIPYARLTLDMAPDNTKARIIGVAQAYTPGMKLEPGEYVVEIKHPDYGTHRLYVVAQPYQNIELGADLKAECGGIELEPVQDGVTVYLDGQEVFKNKLHLTDLIPGPHKLQVWKSLYKPFTMEVLVQPGKVQTVAIDLEQAEHFSNEFGMTFVKIPAGKFMMGFKDSPEQEAEKSKVVNHPGVSKYELVYYYSKHYPHHLVEITKPFYLQTTEVTLMQWQLVMGETLDSLDWMLQQPVNDLVSDKILAFIDILNSKSKGKIRYRLPTEAEWEYACRAGTTTPFYTGETISPDQAFYDWEEQPYAYGKKREKFGGFRPVRQFSPNPWGLYGMHGNVAEACEDWLDFFYYTHSPIKDPVNHSDKPGLYIARGGDSGKEPARVSSAHRLPLSSHMNLAGGATGLRLVAERLAPPR